jgi:acyl-CoA synthetase (AMP-forming)/AMP-acid ligase II
MFHCSGYMHAMLTTLVAGATYYTAQRLQVQEAWDIFTSERITRFHGPMVCLQEMALLPQFDRARLRYFDRALVGGPAVEMARLEQVYGTRTCELYGLTETGGNTTMCRVTDPIEMRHNSDGRPHDGLEVKIVDPDTGIEQPLGATGEIRIRGWNVMHGYFRDPAATAKAVDAEGWLRTGDQGLQYEGGFIKYLSRLKDVIRVGGENLAPLEVEEVLMGHPSVKEAAVVAASHARLGEVPVAFIIPTIPDTENAAELASYCRAELANFKVPIRFIFMDDLPRAAAVHRVAKAKLREMLEQEAKV